MTTGHYCERVRRKILKEDILEAGLELMFRHGFGGTGIKDITEALKMPKGSFYNHFENKEEFGLQVLDLYCQRGLALHKQMLMDEKKPPLKRLERLYDGFIRQYQKVFDCQLGCVMGNFSLELADTHEVFRKALEREFNAIEAVIAVCIAEAQERGEIEQQLDAKTLAAFVLNSWHGAIVRMKSAASIKPLKDFKKLIFGQILN